MMAALLAMLLAAGGHRADAPWPTKAWSESKPEAQGLNIAPLDALDAEFASGKHGYVDSMLVIRHGAVVYEKTYDWSKDYTRLSANRGEPGIYNYYDPGWHP